MTQEPLLRIDRGHVRQPNLKRRGLKSSERSCKYVTAVCVFEDTGEEEQKFKRRETGEKRPCVHRSFLYHVNHLVLSLCICHATRISKKKGIKVKAA